MSDSNRPNLFDFATKELSQDAFICWLVSWVNCSADPQLQQYAKEFVVLLYNSANEEKISADEVQSVTRPKKQSERIDVLFEANIRDKASVFLVEDKTWTKHHSKQLEDYKTAISVNLAGKQLNCVYFKSGYLFKGREDLAPIKLKYGIVDYRALQNFFDKRESDNAIFQDYAHARTREASEIDDRIRAMKENNDYDKFRFDYVQWEFMRNLAGNLCIKSKDLNHNTSRGRPWTNLSVYRMENAPYGKREIIFYRLDHKGKGQYYFSLRQYANLKRKKDKITDEMRAMRKGKLARLKVLRAAFEDAKSAGSLKWIDPRSDNKGKNESEIAYLLFDSECNTVSRVLEEMSAVHKEFLANITQLSG